MRSAGCIVNDITDKKFDENLSSLFYPQDSIRTLYQNNNQRKIVILFLISIIFIIPINQFFENSIEILICSVLIFSVDKKLSWDKTLIFNSHQLHVSGNYRSDRVAITIWLKHL